MRSHFTAYIHVNELFTIKGSHYAAWVFFIASLQTARRNARIKIALPRRAYLDHHIFKLFLSLQFRRASLLIPINASPKQKKGVSFLIHPSIYMRSIKDAAS
jgi:hypothetical protein